MADVREAQQTLWLPGLTAMFRRSPRPRARPHFDFSEEVVKGVEPPTLR